MVLSKIQHHSKRQQKVSWYIWCDAHFFHTIDWMHGLVFVCISYNACMLHGQAKRSGKSNNSKMKDMWTHKSKANILHLQNLYQFKFWYNHGNVHAFVVFFHGLDVSIVWVDVWVLCTLIYLSGRRFKKQKKHHNNEAGPSNKAPESKR